MPESPPVISATLSFSLPAGLVLRRLIARFRIELRFDAGLFLVLPREMETLVLSVR